MAAIDIYEAIVARWFLPFAPRLQTAVTLPALVSGHIAHSSDPGFGAWVAWHLEPLPEGSVSDAEFKIDVEGSLPRADVRDLYARVRSMRPESAEWIGATVHQQVLHIYGPTPATDLAYTWLWNDLRRISWTKGSAPR